MRKIFYVQGALTHFMNRQVSFDNTRCVALDQHLQREEYAEFRQNSPVEKYEYLATSIRKSRSYLMKEDDSTIPAAVRNMYILAVLHYGLLTLIWGSVAYCGFGYLQNTGLYRELFVR